MTNDILTPTLQTDQPETFKETVARLQAEVEATQARSAAIRASLNEWAADIPAKVREVEEVA